MCELLLPVYDVSASKSRNKSFFYSRWDYKYDFSDFYPRFSDNWRLASAPYTWKTAEIVHMS